jgi:hypothetical protein
MSDLRKLICRWFGHRYREDDTGRNYEVCTRCGFTVGWN